MFALRVDDELDLVLLEPHHAAELFSLVDASRAHLRPWMPWVDATRSPDDTAAFIRSALEQHAKGAGVHVGLRAGGRLHGVTSLYAVDPTNRRASLGYWLAAGSTGRGLVTRGTRALVAHAFSTLGLHRVDAHCAVDNARSRAVARRLGFVEEGTLRAFHVVQGVAQDMVVCSRLATDR